MTKLHLSGPEMRTFARLLSAAFLPSGSSS
jgi:hypothetical protein